MTTEPTVTVTIPAALAREYCARIHHENTPHARLKEALLEQLPREIEEGCRVRPNPEQPILAGWVGTCGKPLNGFVLVQWDDHQHPQKSPLASLVRID